MASQKQSDTLNSFVKVTSSVSQQSEPNLWRTQIKSFENMRFCCIYM